LKLIEDGAEAVGVEACGLPEVSRGRLKEAVGIEGIGLWVGARGEVEADAGADEGLASLGVGIGGEDPAFVAVIAEYLHQVADVELDAVDSGLEELLDGLRGELGIGGDWGCGIG
jgi:hypothetical protein